MTTQTAIAEPDVNALAAAIAGMSVEQLVELRKTTAGEIERAQRAIYEQPELARAAFERKDADGVRAAFESEVALARRLAAEQARESMLASRVNELVAGEVATARAAIGQRLQGVNSQTEALATALLESISALEKCVSDIENPGRAGFDAWDFADQTRAALSARCAGYVPGIGSLAPAMHPRPEVARAVAWLEQLLERTKQIVAKDGLARIALP